MTLNPAPLVAIQGNRTKSKARRIAYAIVLLLARLPLVYPFPGHETPDIECLDWSKTEALNVYACTGWLATQHTGGWAVEDLALQWLWHLKMIGHGAT